MRFPIVSRGVLLGIIIGTVVGTVLICEVATRIRVARWR
jgi:Na+/H+ antiporter NhaA